MVSFYKSDVTQFSRLLYRPISNWQNLNALQASWSAVLRAARRIIWLRERFDIFRGRESQRDSGLKPRVGRNELPWVNGCNPNGFCSVFAPAIREPRLSGL